MPFMSGQDKTNLFNIIVKTIFVVLGTLLSIIFYEGKEYIKEIGKDVTVIKVQMMHQDDRIGTHADAINELKSRCKEPGSYKRG